MERQTITDRLDIEKNENYFEWYHKHLLYSHYINKWKKQSYGIRKWSFIKF